MTGLILILIFVVLMAIPGFYIILRKLFPKRSKRSAMWLSIGITIVLVAILIWKTWGTLPA